MTELGQSSQEFWTAFAPYGLAPPYVLARPPYGLARPPSGLARPPTQATPPLFDLACLNSLRPLLDITNL